MKKIILLLLVVVIGFGTAFKCGSKGVGTGGGGAKDDWETVRSVSSTWIVLPEVRPPLMSGPNAVKIYANNSLTTEQIQNYTAGVQDTLNRSNWDNPKFIPSNWWKNEGKAFSVLEDYAIMLKPPDGQSGSEEYKGCGLLHVRAGEVVTAIGTNVGHYLINGAPKAPSGLYLVIAAPHANELPDVPCDTLRRRGTAAEAEHARAMGVPAIWFDVQAIDFTTGHPYFRGPNGEGMALKADQDYSPHFPRKEQLLSITVNGSEDQLKYLEKKMEQLADE